MFRALACVLAVFPTIAIAQQDLPKHVERIEVNIANVDVVVTDKKGNVITGLKKEDFELLENKVAQPIVNFYEAGTNAATKDGEPMIDVASAGLSSPPRRLIFYIDNTTLTAVDRNRLLEEMKKFAADTMRPGDEALVATFNKTLRVRVPFTNDAKLIGAAFDVIATEGAGGDTLRRLAAAAQADIAASNQHQQRIMAAKSYADTVMNDLRQSIKAMQTLMTNAAGLDGKKALVLASEGFPIFPGREMFELIDRLGDEVTDRDAILRTKVQPREAPTPGTPRVPLAAQPTMTAPNMPGATKMRGSAIMEAREFDAHKLIEGLGSTANAYGITLYTIHAGALGGNDAGDVERRSSSNSSTAMASRANSESGMQTLAEVTGGIASVKSSKHESAFERIRRDLDSYYSLGYRPEGGTGERNLLVRLKQRGYIVRARRTHVQKSLESEMSDRVLSNLLSKPRGNDLNVKLTAEEMTVENNKVRFPLRIHVPYESLSLIEQNGGGLEGGFDVYLVAADIGGAMSQVVHRAQKITLTAAQAAAIKGQSVTYPIDFLMNKNVARVSVGVVDSVSNVASFARLEP